MTTTWTDDQIAVTSAPSPNADLGEIADAVMRQTPPASRNRHCVGLALAVQDPDHVFRTEDPRGGPGVDWIPPNYVYGVVVRDRRNRDGSYTAVVEFVEPEVMASGLVSWQTAISRSAVDALEPDSKLAALVQQIEVSMTSLACFHEAVADVEGGFAGRLCAGRQLYREEQLGRIGSVMPRAWCPVRLSGWDQGALADFTAPLWGTVEEGMTQLTARLWELAEGGHMPAGFYRQVARQIGTRRSTLAHPSWACLVDRFGRAAAEAASEAYIRATLEQYYAAPAWITNDENEAAVAAAFVPATWAHAAGDALPVRAGTLPGWRLTSGDSAKFWDPAVDAYILPAVPTPPQRWLRGSEACGFVIVP